MWLWGHVTVVSFGYNVRLAYYFCWLYLGFKIKFVLICEEYHDEQKCVRIKLLLVTELIFSICFRNTFLFLLEPISCFTQKYGIS